MQRLACHNYQTDMYLQLLFDLIHWHSNRKATIVKIIKVISSDASLGVKLSFSDMF